MAPKDKLKPDVAVDPLALWRFSVIAPMLHRSPGVSLSRIAWRQAAEKKKYLDGTYWRVAPDTLMRWFRRYQQGNLDALRNHPRCDRGRPRALDQTAASLLLELADAHHNWTVEEIRRQAQLQLVRQLPIKPIFRLLKGRPRRPKSQVIDNQNGRWRVRPLNDDDRVVLAEWRKSRDKRQWEKAVAILDNSRLSLEQIASKIERPMDVVKEWIKDFNTGGVNALDKPRKPRSISQEQHKAREMRRKGILAILHDRPPAFGINRSNWSLRALAQAYQTKHREAVSVNTVSRCLRKSGYGIRKAKRVLTSPDPDYREKVELLLKTLQNLGPGDLLFFIDEMGPLRIKKYGGRTFVPKGEVQIVQQIQPNRGSITMAGALNATTNQVSWMFCPAKNTSAMIDLIEWLDTGPHLETLEVLHPMDYAFVELEELFQGQTFNIDRHYSSAGHRS